MQNHLQRFQFITIILLLMLVEQAVSQRGGGGGGSSGGGGGYSSGYSSYGGYGYNRYGYGYGGYSTADWWITGSIFACCCTCLCAGAIYAIIMGRKQQQQKRRIISQQMQFQQAKVTQYPSYLSQEQTQNIIDSFRNQKWTIQYQDRFDGCLDQSSFQLNYIENKAPYIYQFAAQSCDEVGPSHLTGLLTFQNNNLCIFFQKTYNNRAQAGQTDTYQVLIYEGAQQGENLQGRWYYYGHEHEEKYSGRWIMNHY